MRWAVALAAVGAALAPAGVALGVPLSNPSVHISGSSATKSHLPKSVAPRITAAAWFQPDPLCATPLGCGAIKLPTIDPYPKGTYHVGVAVGRQTARAFLAVALGKVAQAAHGGTLTIPLDTSPTDGSLAPNTAHINVCVTYQAVTDIEGSFDGAPSANCLPAAHATYVAKPAPHLVANLKRLGGKLAGVKGFALLPADASPTSAWSVVFKLPTANSQASQLPSLKLLVGQVSRTTKPSAGSGGHHHSDSPAGGDSSTGLGGGSAVDPGPSFPLPSQSVAPPSTQQPVVARPTSARRFVTVGYQYPEIWLFPIALILLVPFTIRALTRDLTRPR
ncbi:MAG TPA: hypothetical protein VHV76_01110 [Mycobacteriales bacterium]|nr:hypothetical protein [Mycobacteriales bacterium]